MFIRGVLKKLAAPCLSLCLALGYLLGSVSEASDRSAQETQVTNILALKVRGKISDEELQRARERLEARFKIPIMSGLLLSRYRMIVVSTPQHLKIRAEVSRLAGRLFRRIDPAVKVTKFPVFQTRTGIKIPTGELLVQFKPEVTDERARRIISNLKLEIINREGNKLQGFYLASDPRDDLNRLSLSVRTLNQSGLVEYAELNYLQQSKDYR